MAIVLDDEATALDARLSAPRAQLTRLAAHSTALSGLMTRHDAEMVAPDGVSQRDRSDILPRRSVQAT
jgi:hypothetical protein